jgi:inosine/xanthosine triphosphatase
VSRVQISTRFKPFGLKVPADPLFNMKLNIGSENNVKINAVKEAIQDYDFLSGAEVVSVEADSDVSEQPKSMNETIKGAMNRAKKVFKNCDYSFGIEDGLMKVENTKTDYMNICVCAIYDGKNFHIGFSSAYEYPAEVTKLVINEGHDINQAFYKLKLTDKKRVGSEEGAIGILTKGRLKRKEYTKQGIVMALIHLENSELF